MHLLPIFGVYLLVDCFFRLQSPDIHPNLDSVFDCTPQDGDLLDLLCLCHSPTQGVCGSLSVALDECLLDDGNTTIAPPSILDQSPILRTPATTTTNIPAKVRASPTKREEPSTKTPTTPPPPPTTTT